MGHDLVLRGGRVIGPAAGLEATADAAISGGRIAAIGPAGDHPDERRHGAGRCWIGGKRFAL
ncbi:MAG: hypothetical protein LPK12_16675 [Rhodobacterales bacterium]|nr:hypothetical protein [Rhodobacterales bacterium]MDX5501578.1 hypothetical protein [Rhodobacterales bacterium]